MSQAAASTASTTRHQTRWGAVASIAVGAFVMVTTEFLPIGLLGRIAHDIGATQGEAGLLLTAPGLTAAIAAPLGAVWAKHLDRRTILLALTALIIASNLAMAAAPNLILALAARAVLGASVGGFWAFSTAVARRLVPEASGNRATALILSGISLGTVIGVPAGAMLGHWLGWRSAFLFAAAAASVVLAGQWVLLPALPSSGSKSFASLLSLLNNRLARIGLAASALLAGGHFAAYTFLEPYLHQGMRLGAGATSLVLGGYGLAGLAGTMLGERLASRRLGGGFIAVAALLAATILAASLTTRIPAAAIMTVTAWGAAFGAVPIFVQVWTYQAAPDLFEEGSALTVTAFEMALAVGAAFGGGLLDAFDFHAAFWAGSASCLLGAIVIATARVAPEAKS